MQGPAQITGTGNTLMTDHSVVLAPLEVLQVLLLGVEQVVEVVSQLLRTVVQGIDG